MQVVVAFLVLLLRTEAGSAVPVTRCHPADYICEGRCPEVPPGVELPPEEDQGSGLCFKDTETEACVCWLRNTGQHLQTLFKCEVATNNTIQHVMCLPPPICFPPGPGPGCMIVPRCPCTDPQGRGVRFGRWRSGVAFILRSKTPALAAEDDTAGDAPGPPGLSESREFSVKHLLFLLAFVIAPLLCWCLLTFFHEGKCGKKRRTPESQPMATQRGVEEVEALPLPGPCVAPTAPKVESPPPYREAVEPGERCLLAADCGPPPPYEESPRDGQRVRR